MPDDLAQELMEKWEKRDNGERRRNFIARMEHKLHNKERRAGRSRY